MSSESPRFSIEVSPHAERDLAKLPGAIARLILEEIRALSRNLDHLDRQRAHENRPAAQLAEAVASPAEHGSSRQARAAVGAAGGDARRSCEIQDRYGDGGFILGPVT